MAMSSEKIISLAEAKTNNPLCKFIFEFVDAKFDLAESAKDLKGRVILVSNSLDSYDNLIKVFHAMQDEGKNVCVVGHYEGDRFGVFY